MTRRFFAWTTVLRTAAALAASAFAQSITVIMPRHEMDLVGLWEQRTAQYTQDTGIEVEFIQMSWDEVANKVLTDLAAGGGTNDVIEFDNGWVSQFAATGWLEPLNDYADPDYLDALLLGLLSTFSNDGNVLGIRWNNDTRFFIYNEAMLERAGIDAPPTRPSPTTGTRSGRWPTRSRSTSTASAPATSTTPATSRSTNRPPSRR